MGNGNKILLVFTVLSLIFLILIVSSHSIYHYYHSVNDQKEKAWLLVKTISKALEFPMLAGEMGMVEAMLKMVGTLEHLKRVHITNTEGIICYSATPDRVETPTGSQIIKTALKTKKNIGGFEKRDFDYIYSLALPILNESRCYPCHGKKKEILGVLRVGIDWTPVRKHLTILLQREIVVALIYFLIIFLIAIFLQRLYNNAQTAVRYLKQTQEQLIKTEKMAAIGQMAAAISHDLRNPLTGIKIATYYLNSKINKKQTELTNIIKDIELEIDYASNVVTNILTFARPMQLIYTHADINKIIEDAMPFVHLQTRGQKIKIEKNYNPKIPKILIDVKQMKQVLVNLLSNAVQAMPKEGKLSISTDLKDGVAEIKIEDNGVGIAKDQFNKIFTPFFTTKARGVGLGLSIVNNIVEKHGGRVEVYSELGLGTKFIISLPIRDEKGTKAIGEHYVES